METAEIFIIDKQNLDDNYIFDDLKYGLKIKLISKSIPLAKIRIVTKPLSLV